MRIEGLERCRVECKITRPDGTVLIATVIPLQRGNQYRWGWASNDGSQSLELTAAFSDLCVCIAAPERCPVHGPLLRELPVFEAEE